MMAKITNLVATFALGSLVVQALASEQDALKLASIYAEQPNRLLDAATIWNEILESPQDEAAATEARRKLEQYQPGLERELKAKLNNPTTANLTLLMKAFPRRPEAHLTRAALSAKTRDIPLTITHLEAAVDNGATLTDILDRMEFSDLLTQADGAHEFEKFLDESFGPDVTSRMKRQQEEPRGSTVIQPLNYDALTPAEKAKIDLSLAKIDMNEAFEELGESLGESARQELEREQREWVSRRDAISDSESRRKFIQERTAELQRKRRTSRSTSHSNSSPIAPTASIREAETDRELNRAYAALRKTLDEPAKQELKREQLQWLKRRDATADPRSRLRMVSERTVELQERLGR